MRRIAKVSLVGVILRAESRFSRTSARKSTVRTQNDTDSANFRYTANKKYRSYHVRNVFNRVSESRLALALKYAFPHLERNILLLNSFKMICIVLMLSIFIIFKIHFLSMRILSILTTFFKINFNFNSIKKKSIKIFLIRC